MPINVGPPLVEPIQTAPLTRPLDPPPAPKLTYPAPVAVTPEVKPLAVSQSAPKTSFDLDIHSVKASDTYDSISREHYNDAKYAIALKQFNGGRALPNSGSIDIPPIHVLRKQYPGSISTSTGRPTNGGSSEWVTPGATAPASPPPTEFRASRSGQYSVPAGGATLKAIARATLGTDQRWNEIWDMNPKLVRADDVIPAGTTLALPSDARIP